jgi:hypothetical protein
MKGITVAEALRREVPSMRRGKKQKAVVAGAESGGSGGLLERRGAGAERGGSGEGQARKAEGTEVGER